MFLVVWNDSEGCFMGEKNDSLSDAQFKLKELFYEYAPKGYRKEDVYPYLEWEPEDKVFEYEGDYYLSGPDEEGMKMHTRAMNIENMGVDENGFFLTEEEAFIDASHTFRDIPFSAKIFEV